MEWSLLADLHDEDRRAVMVRAVRRRYRRGDTLFHEGDPGDTLHLLAKGRVGVRVSTPLGELATLSVLGPGTSFGELALVFPDSRRTATAVALEAVETLTVSSRDFEAVCAEHPRVQRALIAALAADVRRLSAQVLEALHLPADKRILRRLAGLAQLYDDGSGPPVVVALTQEELASMAGTTRPTVNRVLQQLVSEDVVAVSRGRIVVNDPARVAHLGR